MHARREREKYEKMGRYAFFFICDERQNFLFSLAKWNGLVLNIAIGLQVILGALVTGLSSAISPSKVRNISTFTFKKKPPRLIFKMLIRLGGRHDINPG